MWRIKCQNRMYKIENTERWGNSPEEMGGLETSIWHGLIEN